MINLFVTKLFLAKCCHGGSIPFDESLLVTKLCVTKFIFSGWTPSLLTNPYLKMVLEILQNNLVIRFVGYADRSHMTPIDLKID